MGTGAFGAGLFGMNMEAEGLFNEGSEGLFYPVSGTLCGALTYIYTIHCNWHHSMSMHIRNRQDPANSPKATEIMCSAIDLIRFLQSCCSRTWL